jgi:hypothetical protein
LLTIDNPALMEGAAGFPAAGDPAAGDPAACAMVVAAAGELLFGDPAACVTVPVGIKVAVRGDAHPASSNNIEATCNVRV